MCIENNLVLSGYFKGIYTRESKNKYLIEFNYLTDRRFGSYIPE